jgi:hypothetical protein
MDASTAPAAALPAAEGVGRHGAAVRGVLRRSRDALARRCGRRLDVTNLAAHHRTLSWWDPKAQEEVWGSNPMSGSRSGIAFTRDAACLRRRRRADRGMEFLLGHRPFGLEHARLHRPDGDKIIDYVYCLVPPRTTGDRRLARARHARDEQQDGALQGRVRSAHRVLSMYVNRPGHSWPGLAVHTNPHYRDPTSALGGTGSAASRWATRGRRWKCR